MCVCVFVYAFFSFTESCVWAIFTTITSIRPEHTRNMYKYMCLMSSKVVRAQINGNTAKSRMKEIINKQKKTGDEFFSVFANSCAAMWPLLLLLSALRLFFFYPTHSTFFALKKEPRKCEQRIKRKSLQFSNNNIEEIRRWQR